MFAFIVIALLVCVLAVVQVWCLSPAYRKRVEEPKYRFLEMQREFFDQPHTRLPEQSTKPPAEK
ncbi:hypothetical protein KTQ54_15095 [Komagataeibacter oboediens]|uniref:hypothetical protein n=1 Tax=Komagataeibacter oboediens TaxID=65958 RepID=UPI000FE19FC2|nr:hypothetical protein [Komagataeibacter oboediens]MBV0889837.1 hypothetical protein [Komagataeibacter oboediens]